MATLRGNPTVVWGAGGTTIDPGTDKTLEGWLGGETPMNTTMNYAHAKTGNSIKYLFENGIGEWGPDVEYQDKALAMGSNRKLYVSRQADNKNHDVTDTNFWLPLSHYQGIDGEIKMFHAVSPAQVATLQAAGWRICDGTQETPNMIDKFVMGSSVANQNREGGSNVYTPNGSITTTTSPAGDHTHTVGTNDHVLTQAQTPAHNHSRGSMNITGNSFSVGASYASGAFYRTSTTHGADGGSGNWNGAVAFNAARTWSGVTSSVGGSQAHNHGTTTSSDNGAHVHAASSLFKGTQVDNRPAYISVLYMKFFA